MDGLNKIRPFILAAGEDRREDGFAGCSLADGWGMSCRQLLRQSALRQSVGAEAGRLRSR